MPGTITVDASKRSWINSPVEGKVVYIPMIYDGRTVHPKGGLGMGFLKHQQYHCKRLKNLVTDGVVYLSTGERQISESSAVAPEKVTFLEGYKVGPKNEL